MIHLKSNEWPRVGAAELSQGGTSLSLEVASGLQR
jgi:hypothetical protein